MPSKFHHNKPLTEKQQQQRSACKERVDKKRQLQSHDLEELPANIQDLPGNIQGEYKGGSRSTAQQHGGERTFLQKEAMYLLYTLSVMDIHFLLHKYFTENKSKLWTVTMQKDIYLFFYCYYSIFLLTECVVDVLQ